MFILQFITYSRTTCTVFYVCLPQTQHKSMEMFVQRNIMRKTIIKNVFGQQIMCVEFKLDDFKALSSMELTINAWFFSFRLKLCLWRIFKVYHLLNIKIEYSFLERIEFLIVHLFFISIKKRKKEFCNKWIVIKN